MRPRLLLLPLAAVVIAALCVYKVTRTYDPVSAGAVADRRQPPLFELLDQRKPSEIVRLSSYVGRHTILVVFFDGEAGFDHDRTLMRLARQADAAKSRGLMVLGISTALPQQNRAVAARLAARKILPDGFPFPLLSDLKPDVSVHRAWGRYDPRTEKTLPGVFLIDRAGLTPWGPAGPLPLPDPAATLDELLGRDVTG